MFEIFLMSNVSRVVNYRRSRLRLFRIKSEDNKKRKNGLIYLNIVHYAHEYMSIEKKHGAKAHRDCPTLHNASSAGRETVESIDAVLSIVDFKANHSLGYSPQHKCYITSFYHRQFATLH